MTRSVHQHKERIHPSTAALVPKYTPVAASAAAVLAFTTTSRQTFTKIMMAEEEKRIVVENCHTCTYDSMAMY